MEMTDHAADMATKLDALMDILFTFVGTEAQKGEKHREQLFLILMQLFDAFIIKTYKSKYIQFLLFYICSTDIGFIHTYVHYLVEKLMDVGHHSLTRSTCVAYLGSFLARSIMVPPLLIQDTLRILGGWVYRYASQHMDAVPDAEMHRLFYAVCQAIFYVFCFKYQELSLGTPEGNAFFQSLGIDDIIQSRLNPLKLCAATVVAEFVKITVNLFGLLPSYSIVVEHNKSIVLPTKSVYGNANQLDSFFPFDPYLLRHSSKHINSIYQTWNPAPLPPPATPSSSASTPTRSTPLDTPATLQRFQANVDDMSSSPVVSMATTPESVSNDVDFFKYSWGGK